MTLTLDTPAAAAPGSHRSRWRRWLPLMVFLLVLALLATAGGIFAHRVRETVLIHGGYQYSGNTPFVTLDYGGGDRYVVDDTVGTLHPVMFTVENPGPATVTLRGVDDFVPLLVARFRVSRFGPDGPDVDVATARRVPLDGVTIRPGQQVGLWIYLKGQGCVAAGQGAATTIDSVPVTVDVLGFTRIDWVPLPTMIVVMNNPNGPGSDPRSCLHTAS